MPPAPQGEQNAVEQGLVITQPFWYNPLEVSEDRGRLSTSSPGISSQRSESRTQHGYAGFGYQAAVLG